MEFSLKQNVSRVMKIPTPGLAKLDSGHSYVQYSSTACSCQTCPPFYNHRVVKTDHDQYSENVGRSIISVKAKRSSETL